MTSRERDRSPFGTTNHPNGSAFAPPSLPSTGSFHGANDTFAFGQYNNVGAYQYTDALNDPTFPQNSQQQTDNLLDQAYSDLHTQYQNIYATNPLVEQKSAFPNQDFLQAQDFGVGADASYNYGQEVQSNGNITSNTFQESDGRPGSGSNESAAFPSFDFSQHDFDQISSLDPSLLSGDSLTSIDDLSQQTSTGYNDSLDMMTTMQHPPSPTPPHLFPEMAHHHHSNGASPAASPGVQQMGFGNLGRPRNASESLDPASAMYPQGQNDWVKMGAYRSHRRTPSDYSDVSSHSNQASPYLQTFDSFDGNGHSSPLLNPSQDPALNDGLGLGQFNLNEVQSSAQQSYYSPGQSPHISPRVVPQQQELPTFSADDDFGLKPDVKGQLSQHQNGLDVFPGTVQESFPSYNAHHSPNDFGQADQMSPPEINIDFAPPAKNTFDNPRPNNTGIALSPPIRSPNRSRMRERAKSDPYAGSRSASPSLYGRGRSPSLQPNMQGPEQLAPFSSHTNSRSPSPARSRDASPNRARSSSNASDREHMIQLADPERPGKDMRTQKHPATFQCHLCPKKFTRAYNLRSHLRTHTDERPFVCTICGKAFARQHDRKRHEGLHSGEKRFVCKGGLQTGGQWGCGRKFARADALGRHFRSEAGRVCIKPLLDEEAAERQKAWTAEQQQAQVADGLVAPQVMMGQPQMDMLGNFLPAALLQQYPALAGIDWNSIPQGPPPDEDYGGRSSFDASSGGEYYEDISENEMVSYQDPRMNGMNGMNGNGMQQGTNYGLGLQTQPDALNYGYANQTSDYLTDFEGR